ncbi:MAG TPA: hypothetical protein VFV38_22690 [Ktedonobacteraceae bacterium]|nr:hypothetical protein [Ktedonobacteraceae bacterium]
MQSSRNACSCQVALFPFPPTPKKERLFIPGLQRPGLSSPFSVNAAGKPPLTQAGEKEASYGRWPYPVMPRLIPGMLRDWFVTALKK